MKQLSLTSKPCKSEAWEKVDQQINNLPNLKHKAARRRQIFLICESEARAERRRVMKWADQYKHPLWQKKRLEALDKAEYACQCCGDSESQLHVHHKQYFKGRMIWQYETGELSVLCAECHEAAHAQMDELKSLLSALDPDGVPSVISLIAGYCMEVNSSSVIHEMASWDIANSFDEKSFQVGRVAAFIENKFLAPDLVLKFAEQVGLVEKENSGEICNG